jgi:hypothetical protein
VAPVAVNLRKPNALVEQMVWLLARAGTEEIMQSVRGVKAVGRLNAWMEVGLLALGASPKLPVPTTQPSRLSLPQPSSTPLASQLPRLPPAPLPLPVAPAAAVIVVGRLLKHL